MKSRIAIATIVACAGGLAAFLANLNGARDFICSIGVSGACLTHSPQTTSAHPQPSLSLRKSMENPSPYARNFERLQLQPQERYNQVVTIFDTQMAQDRRQGVQIAPNEYVEIFKVVGRDDDVVVQVRIDKGSYWVLSRQTILLNDYPPLISRNPETDEATRLLFQDALQDQIDATRYLLKAGF
jgi:hypothetical protein